MGCINPDGTMEPAARALLQALRTPRTPDELSREIKYPLYRIRSLLRETAEAGLVSEGGGGHALTAAGKERVAALSRGER
jgi:hypothetical protein